MCSGYNQTLSEKDGHHSPHLACLALSEVEVHCCYYRRWHYCSLPSLRLYQVAYSLGLCQIFGHHLFLFLSHHLVGLFSKGWMTFWFQKKIGWRIQPTKDLFSNFMHLGQLRIDRINNLFDMWMLGVMVTLTSKLFASLMVTIMKRSFVGWRSRPRRFCFDVCLGAQSLTSSSFD